MAQSSLEQSHGRAKELEHNFIVMEQHYQWRTILTISTLLVLLSLLCRKHYLPREESDVNNLES